MISRAGPRCRRLKAPAVTDQAAVALAPISLDTRYTAGSGTIFLTGMQAMLRILVEQARADRRQGLDTAGFLCGYPGSPLGGVDSEYQRNSKQFEAESVQHQLGLNEELAATAVWLASPAGAYVTGQTIAVDGGFTIT